MSTPGALFSLDEQIAGRLTRDEHGLVCAVVQDASSREVLMVGWMSDEALAATLGTGLATFFSRSRQRLWVKGEESGNYLQVREVRLDCDADTLLVTADPMGPTCHTGTTSCFTDGLIHRADASAPVPPSRRSAT
jgi:phosphoribosyl-AMP cyclohydrolase